MPAKLRAARHQFCGRINHGSRYRPEAGEQAGSNDANDERHGNLKLRQIRRGRKKKLRRYGKRLHEEEYRRVLRGM